MYATIEFKGKQYKAEEGVVLTVDKLDAEQGSKIDIETVLLVSDGDKISVGTPYVKGAKVQVVVEESFKDKKVFVISSFYHCGDDFLPEKNGDKWRRMIKEIIEELNKKRIDIW